jgi:hypothetical protein
MPDSAAVAHVPLEHGTLVRIQVGQPHQIANEYIQAMEKIQGRISSWRQ